MTETLARSATTKLHTVIAMIFIYSKSDNSIKYFTILLPSPSRLP